MNKINQVFKEALRHEIRAGAFYEQAAEKTQNGEARMLFLELALMENSHADQIISKAEKMSPHEETDFDSYRAELEDVSQKDFSPHELKPFSNFPLEKVLHIAIAKEKKASQHYLQLGKTEENGELKKLFMELADDEKHHSLSISRILSSLNMDEKDRPAL